MELGNGRRGRVGVGAYQKRINTSVAGEGGGVGLKGEGGGSNFKLSGGRGR